jgi:hypothetical protein
MLWSIIAIIFFPLGDTSSSDIYFLGTFFFEARFNNFFLNSLSTFSLNLFYTKSWKSSPLVSLSCSINGESCYPGLGYYTLAFSMRCFWEMPSDSRLLKSKPPPPRGLFRNSIPKLLTCKVSVNSRTNVRSLIE